MTAAQRFMKRWVKMTAKQKMAWATRRWSKLYRGRK